MDSSRFTSFPVRRNIFVDDHLVSFDISMSGRLMFLAYLESDVQKGFDREWVIATKYKEQRLGMGDWVPRQLKCYCSVD